jgi:hypothetical protein
MDNIFEMGTTARHWKLLRYLAKSTFDLFERNELEDFSESSSLVYYGDKCRAPVNCELVNISCVDDITDFKHSVINDLEFVVPDYMYFKKGNEFIINKKETKIAGYPNLIVEVWSESNSSLDRQFKKYLYSTSPTTEHWYIEQDSNVVECYFGQERIGDKNLADILVSRDGIEFDLRYLKLAE